MKKHYFFFLVLFSFFYLAGQTQTVEKSDKTIIKNFYINLGGSFSDYQDVDYSNVQQCGFGGNFKLGFSHQKRGKHFWEAGSVFNDTIDHAKTHDEGKATVMYGNLYFKYLKGINNRFYVGGRIDAFDNYFRIYANLSNNSTVASAGNYLYGSVIYQTNINDRWRFMAIGDLFLLGFQNELPAFAMNYSPNRINNGEVDYQDPALGDPSSYPYFAFCYIGNNFILKTEFLFMYKKRISVAYNWEMRRFSEVSGYPTTWAMHNLVFRFNIIHREK